MADQRNLAVFLDEAHKKLLANVPPGLSGDFAQIGLILHYLNRYEKKEQFSAILAWVEDKLRYTVAEGGWRAKQLVDAVRAETGEITPPKIGQPSVIIQNGNNPIKPKTSERPKVWERLKQGLK